MYFLLEVDISLRHGPWVCVSPSDYQAEALGMWSDTLGVVYRALGFIGYVSGYLNKIPDPSNLRERFILV